MAAPFLALPTKLCLEPSNGFLSRDRGDLGVLSFLQSQHSGNVPFPRLPHLFSLIVYSVQGTCERAKEISTSSSMSL